VTPPEFIATLPEELRPLAQELLLPLRLLLSRLTEEDVHTRAACLFRLVSEACAHHPEGSERAVFQMTYLLCLRYLGLDPQAYALTYQALGLPPTE
jgi:hypothetical protein